MGLVVLRGYGVNQLVVTEGYAGPGVPSTSDVAPIVPWGFAVAEKVVTAGYGGLSSSPVICHPVFLLDEVVLKDDRTLRVRYNQPPSSNVGSSSATAVLNYQLARTDGPVPGPAILAATLASDDADVVD